MAKDTKFRAYLEDQKCRLVSRHKNVYKSFETLRNALAGLRAKSAILDGEIVCLDANGCSQFKQLLYRRGRAVFFAFDLLWLNGTDLRQVPLIERKKKLRKLVERSECSEILYAQHIERNGKLLFEEVCERNLEGMVAKRRMGVYTEHGWLKIKRCEVYASGGAARDVYRVSRASGTTESLGCGRRLARPQRGYFLKERAVVDLRQCVSFPQSQASDGNAFLLTA